MEKILLTHQRLDAQVCTRVVADDRQGGLVVFIGTVRNETKGKNVLRLEFESYEPMAIKEIDKIISQAKVLFGVSEISIHHRLGVVPVGEEAVIIAVASPHRKEAFLACEFCIDTLKETVPIWKKEFFEDGEVWVSANP
jgi:molybdopterin synthase catalytic subunit